MKQAYRCYRTEGVTLDVIRPIRALDQKTAFKGTNKRHVLLFSTWFRTC